jgi:hypothetical protein
MFPSPPDSRDKIFTCPIREKSVGIGDATRYPVSVDYRSSMLPVRDQGDIQGTCGPQTVCAIKEYFNGGSHGYHSPQFLFNLRRDLDINGMTCRDVLKLAQKTGMPTETEYPYETIDSADTIYGNANLMADAAEHRLGSYSLVQGIDSAHAALDTTGPIIIAIPVYNQDDPTKLWVRSPGYTRELGGHAMLIVGYDGMGNFIVRNSWGRDWGDNGFVLFPESDWDIIWEAWVIENHGVSSTKPTKPTNPTNPVDRICLFLSNKCF